jgi:type IV fimbrial biogenesis protein FimT
MVVSRKPERCHGQRGMTLIEQIMVLAITAVLAGIAAPPLRSLLDRNMLQVAQTDFIAALQHARETAIISGKRIVLSQSRWRQLQRRYALGQRLAAGA